jgi:ribosomal protein S18 acetylase RimI-like enzyme
MQATRIEIARAHGDDAPAIAELHAESWRRHYRDAYSDFYLDGDVGAERLAVWTKRLALIEGATCTLIARQDGEIVGFVHARLDADPVWGTLIDNLHVTSELHRGGIGSRLLGEAAQWVIEQQTGQGIYLWVLEQNRSAQAFYLSRGGRICTREPVSPPGGDTRNLNGAPAKLLVAWSDPRALLVDKPDREGNARSDPR